LARFGFVLEVAKWFRILAEWFWVVRGVFWVMAEFDGLLSLCSSL